MDESPQRRTNAIVLFGHDPALIGDRCAVLRQAGFSPVVAATANEAETAIERASVLFLGSHCAPMSRERLAAVARRHDVPVVNIPYSRFGNSPEGVIPVPKGATPSELIDTISRALTRTK
jgi:hypothetical protein